MYGKGMQMSTRLWKLSKLESKVISPRFPRGQKVIARNLRWTTTVENQIKTLTQTLIKIWYMPEVKSQEEKYQPRRNTGRNNINLGWFLLSPLTSISIFVSHSIQNLFHCSYILCTLLDSNFYKMPMNILAPALFSMCLYSGFHDFQRYPVSPQEFSMHPHCPLIFSVRTVQMQIPYEPNF